MIVPVVQRWRDRRSSYRLAGEPIATRLYEVAEIPDDTTARAFVVAHHYSSSFPAARARVGLFRAGALVGVAVFSHPMSEAVLVPLGVERGEGVELGRLVLLDDVPANGESWFLARAFELLVARGFRGVISDADPMRTVDTTTGRLVCRGHVGTVYQGSNAVYLGQTDRRTRYLLPNGLVFSQRVIAKVRSRERGWRYSAETLERFGAPPLGADDDARAWLATWLPRLTTRVRHPGNFRYAFGLDRGAKRGLPKSQPYPKLGLELFKEVA